MQVVLPHDDHERCHRNDPSQHAVTAICTRYNADLYDDNHDDDDDDDDNDDSDGRDDDDNDGGDHDTT